jgi:polyferredoxin
MKFSWRSLRVWIQSLSFLFLLYLLLQTAFPLEIRIPVDLYLRLSPFIGIISLVAQKEFILRMLPAFGVLLLVIILGNFFCGWFCPMGAAIDFFDRVLFREKKRKKPLDDRPLRKIRYGVFVFALAAGLMGWQLMFLLDPISLITRTLVIAFFPPAVYIYNQILPLAQKFLPENPFILTAMPLPVFQINILIFFFFVGILSLGVIRRRFWCRYLCPLGAIVGLAGKISLIRVQREADSCIGCKLCTRKCPMHIQVHEKSRVISSECNMCLNCVDVCPSKGALETRLCLPLYKKATSAQTEGAANEQ